MAQLDFACKDQAKVILQYAATPKMQPKAWLLKTCIAVRFEPSNFNVLLIKNETP